MVKKSLLRIALIFGLVFVASNSSATTPQELTRIVKSSLPQFQFKQQILKASLAHYSVREARMPNSASQNQSSLDRKSKGRAFLQSLILPGWGQHYAESKTMMKVFIGSEVLLWSTYLGFTTWSNWLEDDYQDFAVTHAGINLDGKPKQYFVDIGNFNDILDYNQAQLRDRDVNDLYTDTEEFFWRWDSRENRNKFETLRVRSDRAANRAQLTLAAIFVNHLVSAIHSTLAVFKFNERLAKENLGLQINFDGPPGNQRVKFVLSKAF